MITASQLKKGVAIEVNGHAHIVENVTAQSPSARGGTTLYKIRSRDVISGQKADASCKGDESFTEVIIEKRPAQFLYREPHACCFMDLEDYNQFEIGIDGLADELNFLLEDMEVLALNIDGTVRAIELPDTVNLRITECDPAIKGASATARTKNAVVETGFNLQVPEYLDADEVIKIDTRNGKFLGRAKS